MMSRCETLVGLGALIHMMAVAVVAVQAQTSDFAPLHTDESILKSAQLSIDITSDLTQVAMADEYASENASAGATDPSRGEFRRPKKFNWSLRQNEDWSDLAGRDATQTGDFFDPIKYIPLSEDGEVWLSVGGSARQRLEVWSNFGFGEPNDDEFLLTRVRVHADLHVGPNLRFFVEGKGAFSTDRDLPGGKRGLDVDEAALQQVFVDVAIPLDDSAKLTIRPGRQMLLFGKQRLVSPLPWANTLRAWDGVSVILTAPNLKITGFWTQFVPVQKYDFNDSDAQTEFFGAYATIKVPDAKAAIDLYFLGLDREDMQTFNGTMGDEERYTLGGRVSGKIGDTSLDYDVEGAYQFGDLGTADIDAYMFASQLGLKLAELPAAPRVFIGLDYASGDDQAGGDVETFNHLFPLGHAYHGFIDAIGRQNIVDLSPGIALSPVKKLTVLLQGHWL
jgi:hypothetical protein